MEAPLADPSLAPLHLQLPVDPEGDTLTFHLIAIQPDAGQQGGTVLLNGQVVIVGTTPLSAADMQNLTYLAPVTGDALVETVTLNFDFTDGTNTSNMVVIVNIAPAVDGVFAGTAGADRLDDGAGNDTYTVNNAGDVVLEQANAGIDTVTTTLASYTLGDNVENLTHTGSNAFTGTGNAHDNVLTGGTGDDTLTGGGGNDTLNGTAGTDTAQYSGDRLDYRITAHCGPDGTTYTVQDLRAGSPDGTDTLSNIAQLKFADATFAVNAVAGTTRGDFDGNSHSDVVLVGSDGAVTGWNDGLSASAHQIAPVGTIPTDWHLAGSGDFDGNGQDDFLWRNDNGTVSVWNNGELSGAHWISNPGRVTADWHIAATGDFDGNGNSDILWINDNGTASIWNDGDIHTAHYIAPAGTITNGWHFAATGDFDGNGKSDILWVNDNGAASIWNDGDIHTAHYIAPAGTITDGWHVANTGDYDGNGRADILWQNANGSVSIWDDGQIANAHIIASSVSSMHIV